MVRIVKTEFYKLKRYHILWAGVALMLLSVLLTLFTSMANDGSVWDFAYLTEQVIKNNMSMIFPMCISLIAGYMISREQTVKAKLFCPEIAGLFCRIAGLFCHDSRANLSLKPVCFGIAIS